MTPGHIYILLNNSYTGYLKIGKTTRTPAERAKEISSDTGVPSPFFVAYSVEVGDCDKAEVWVHNALDDHRYAENREFFVCDLELAIEKLKESAKIYPLLCFATEREKELYLEVEQLKKLLKNQQKKYTEIVLKQLSTSLARTNSLLDKKLEKKKSIWNKKLW